MWKSLGHVYVALSEPCCKWEMLSALYNGQMTGNETIGHFYSNPLFALHETIQLGTSLNLPFWRRNVLFVRNSVFQSMFLLGICDSFVALRASGQNHPCQQMGFTAQSTGVKKSLAWDRLRIRAVLWGKGDPYRSQIATFGFPDSWNVARDFGFQFAGRAEKSHLLLLSAFLPFTLTPLLFFWEGGWLVSPHYTLSTAAGKKMPSGLLKFQVCVNSLRSSLLLMGGLATTIPT